MARQTYLIESILPANEVHLLGGPSGAGKTRWLFQSLIDWRSTHTVMGLPCAPFPPVVYLAYDRSQASVDETLSYFPELDIPCHSLRGIRTPIDRLPASFPVVKLFIIDGIATLLPGGKISNYQVVADFLCAAGEVCTKHSITIIGVLHASKTKEGESYLNPRQRIAGSVAWAAFSETVIVVEPVNPDEPKDRKRRLFICPRNASEMSFNMAMNTSGRLLIDSSFELDDDPTDDETTILNILHTKGAMTRKSIFEEVAGVLEIDERTIVRRLESLMNKGLVVKPRYGYYSATVH